MWAQHLRLLGRLGLVGVIVATTLAATSGSTAQAATFPDAGFVDGTYVSGLGGVIEMAWLPDGRMLAAQQSGTVRVVDNGVLQATPFIDITDHVNGIRDRGLLGLTVHPDFPTSPYVYLLFTYDPPETVGQTGLAAPNGRGARVSRLVRVTADQNTGYSTAIAGSEVVLMGTNSTAAHVNLTAPMDALGEITCDTAGVPVRDCLPADSESHTIGSVRFGVDGMLYVGNGDASSYTQRDPRALRSLDLDSMAGKIFRIDPLTGAGLPDNPHWDGDPGSNRSKVFVKGLRNPFRFIVDPDTGALIIGDVGWNTWEEINVGTAGDDFGWPCYEGGQGSNLQQGSYAGLSACSDYYADNAAEPGTIAWNRQGQDGAAIAGVVYTGSAYPTEYSGKFFYGDYAQGWLRHATRSGEELSSPTMFTPDIGAFVAMSQGPDGLIYYADIVGSSIKRIHYNGDQPPPQVVFEYFEGDWTVLPDFDALSPVAVGVSGGFDIGLRQRDDRFGFRFSTCLRVPASGSYTFSTTSDDGSQLFIDGGLVVDNDGLHPAEERTGTVSLTAGVHPIVVTMFERDYFEELLVAWEGPGFGQQAITSSVVVGCGTVLEASPDPVEFGAVTGSAVEVVALTHGGAVGQPDIQITDVSISGSADFTVGAVDLPIVLSPGDSASVTVTFASSGAATSTGVLEVEHSGVNSVTGIALSGSGPSEAPTITVLEPLDGQIERIFTDVSLAADASDAEGPVTVRWTGTLHHGANHVHPNEFVVDGATGSFTLTDHDDNSWIEVCATATDSDGLTATECVDVFPETVPLTFDTAPSGLEITYNGVTRTTPFTVDAVVDASRAVDAQLDQAGWSFESWSNNGAASQTIIVADTPSTYVATYSTSTAPPVAVDDNATVPEDGTVLIDVTANDSDPDGNLDITSVTVVSEPTSGTAVSNGSGSIHYTPNTNYNGSDTLTYSVCDTTELCDTATVTITVTATPPPQVVFEYFEGDWTVLPDFDALSPVAVGVSGGFDIGLRQRDDRFGFRFSTCLRVPASGSYTFSTTSDDGSQLFIDGGLVVDNDGLHPAEERTGTVSLTAGVHPIVVTMFERDYFEELLVAWEGPGFGQQAITSSVVVGCGTVLEASPDPVEFGAVTGSAVEVVALTHGGAVGQPDIQITDVSISGSADFTVGAVDLPIVLSPGDSASVTVTFASSGAATSTGVLEVEHSGVNSVTGIALSGSGPSEAPTITVLEPLDGQIERIFTDVSLAADASDAEGPVTVRWTGTLHHGANHVHPNEFVVDGATGSFTLTDHDDNSWIEVCATATDSDGLTATECVDVFPETVPLTFDTAPSGLEITYNGVTRTTPFTVDAVVDASRAVDAQLDQAGWSFESWSNNGAASQTIIVADTPSTYVATYSTSTAPPVAVDDNATVPEDGTVLIDVTANDSDPDGNLDITSVTVVSEPTSGTAVSNGSGSIHYTPNTNYNGSDTLTYSVCDTTELCDTATVTITVTATPDSPVIQPIGTLRFSAGQVVATQVVASDADGDQLTFSAAGLPSGLQINTQTGLITGTASGRGTFQASVTVDDGTGRSDIEQFRIAIRKR